ncbi:peptidoglycan/LPS O-acetylase OafA/YrhL [Leucobacter exalbidus]|uniref:Peptidoglycan/LPS O-acetylase OafA/YrhL n=1 Tax=Leucobacter exalbidus TaxID=662960 RepID=A0A940PVR9_9MICO|nr:peptidoglycan/LPS O-acetylase OafA/YrhL [Leucobacter exalbidus]
MRAIAVGVVLLYHANAPFLPGGFVGVDIFFVISGYLITGLLLREALTTGRINLAEFYGKRARRILPAATIVLLVTLALTVLFLPQLRWQQIGTEAVGAVFYVANWIFAAGTDYLNAEVAASPLQHFWTLSVEEQFYIVWPLILVALLFAIRGKAVRAEARGTVAPDQARIMRYASYGVLLLLIPSLAWSIYLTATNPAPAYFVTTTRLWEMAVGAALAVFARYTVRIPDAIALTLGWLGLAGILFASLFYTSAVPAFPGSAALLPTLSAAAIIISGMNGRAERGVGVLLKLRPMRWVGDISYSLYLWHWPLIAVGTYLLGDDLRFRWGLLIVALAFIPSWLSYRFIEGPFRDWPRLKKSASASLKAGAVLMLVTVIAAATVIVAPRVLAPQAETIDGQSIGAEALTTDFSNDDIASFTDAGKPVDVIEGGFTPAAIDAREDNPVVYDLGCHLGLEDSEILVDECIFGDPESDTSIVLVGDSHAANWFVPLAALAEKNGWKLRSATKAACGFSAATQFTEKGDYTLCSDWNKQMVEDLRAEKPDLVIMANSNARSRIRDDNGEVLKDDVAVAAFAQGIVDNVTRLEEAGVPTLLFEDTPKMNQDIPDCVSANPDELTKCATSRVEAIDERSNPEQIVVDTLKNVDLIDMNNWTCPDTELCPAVVGNVLMWRDRHHFTETFAKTLVQPLEAALQASPTAQRILY